MKVPTKRGNPYHDPRNGRFSSADVSTGIEAGYLKGKIVPPSEDLQLEVDKTWISNGFDYTKDSIRAEADSILQNGYSGAPDGLIGWRLDQWAKAKERRFHIVAGELVSRAIYSDPTDQILWRGEIVTPERIAEFESKQGKAKIDIPLSSFTPKWNAALRYAKPESSNWSSLDVPDGGVPLIFKLEPGARVARLTVKQDNPYDEHVAFGSFEVVSVKRPDRWSSDPVEVTIRQRSLIRNA